MDILKEPLFNSTGTITEKELIALYGSMPPGKLVLKFAEHKNFNAALEEFQTWDERSVVEMGNLIGQDYRHQTELYSTEDKYIAVTFLKVLLNEWEKNRLKKIRLRLEDPVQQKQAAELLKIRLTGKLPHIDLAGTDFTIDWRLRQMRETELPWKHISFENLEMDESGEVYLVFYHTETHEIFIPEEDIIELPENVVVLEIPNEFKLDPVAVARDYGIGETDLLAEHPIQITLTAKVTPLSESGLPEFIENNIRLQNQDNSKDGPKRVR
jgi:hypothetical protein